MKKFYKKTFTLVELLAAMAVFSVLLVVAMRLFSGSQRIWLRAEQKTNTFSDARTAMEFIAARVQTLVYYEGMPFEISRKQLTASDNKKGDGFNNKQYSIWFATGMPMENRGEDNYFLRFVKFKLDVNDDSSDKSDPGVLKMLIYSDRSNKRKFQLLFPPYEGNPYANSNEDAIQKINTKFSEIEKNNSSIDNGDVVELIKNVTDFKVVSFPAVPASRGKWEIQADETLLGSSTGTVNSPPYFIEIEISLIDNDDKFQQWLDINGNSDDDKKKRDDIFAEYGYTFRRAILVGQRSAE